MSDSKPSSVIVPASVVVKSQVDSKFLKPGDIDREKTCPLLLRVFYRRTYHHKAEDFDRRARDISAEEVQIYTWKDATLRELSDLVKDHIHPSAKSRDAKLSFALVYPDKMGRMVVREVGTCYAHPRRGGPEFNPDDEKTLDSLHFETGDYLDVAIIVPMGAYAQ